MKVVLQRVTNASVSVDNKTVGSIGQGYLALLGVSGSDTTETAAKMIDKIKKLRIFADENGKTNLSILDVCGEILVVSQFTLYADCKKGNRPSFTEAGSAQHAEELYEYFLKLCRAIFPKTESGVFGEHMMVHIENDGPFTVVLDSEKLF